MNSSNYAVENQTGVNNEGNKVNSPVQRLTATSVIGDKIKNPKGEELGTIDNLMFNVETGALEYVVVEYGSFLGLRGKLFAIPYEELTLDPVHKCFVLDKDENYLKNSPGFDKNHWPGTNDHNHEYYNSVGTYYGSSGGFTGV